MYKFEKAHKKFDEWGFPSVQSGSGFQVIKGIDFEEAYKNGSISFEDDGVYLEYEGKKYRGYMFIDLYYVSYNGAAEKFPKFHLVKCSVIQEFIDSGRFNQRYIWSNSDVNDVTDKQSKTLYKDKNLELCSRCRSQLLEEVDSTEEFHSLLDKSELENEVIEVDIFGYVKGKERISKAYRLSKDYTCENCGVKPNHFLHRRWWHTHHKDGDKTHNENSNLECLCILCHSKNDARHEENFATNSMKIELKKFLKEYYKTLKDLGNRYL